jgi:hypothetical protein
MIPVTCVSSVDMTEADSGILYYAAKCKCCGVDTDVRGWNERGRGDGLVAVIIAVHHGEPSATKDPTHALRHMPE